MIAVYLAVFAAPIAAGAVMGGLRWGRERRQLARAFARGRAETVVRLPMPVEPMPTIPPLVA